MDAVCLEVSTLLSSNRQSVELHQFLSTSKDPVLRVLNLTRPWHKKEISIKVTDSNRDQRFLKKYPHIYRMRRMLIQ